MHFSSHHLSRIVRLIFSSREKTILQITLSDTAKNFANSNEMSVLFSHKTALRNAKLNQTEVRHFWNSSISSQFDWIISPFSQNFYLPFLGKSKAIKYFVLWYLDHLYINRSLFQAVKEDSKDATTHSNSNHLHFCIVKTSFSTDAGILGLPSAYYKTSFS